MTIRRITGSITIKGTLDGHPFSITEELSEAAQYSEGPLSFASGCILTVQVACKTIWNEIGTDVGQ